MEETKVLENEELQDNTPDTEEDAPLDKNIKLMSPMQMVLRRFFRSKLSIIGLVMIVGLFLFSFVGPLFFADLGTINEAGQLVYDPNDGKWGEIELDETGTIEYTEAIVEVTLDNGEKVYIKQTIEKQMKDNFLAPPSAEHILGTDNEGYDIFVRLMYGGRISLIIGFIVVILETIIGIILGALAGYFGGWVDQIIMRVVDIFNCIPTLPILLKGMYKV